MPYWLLPLLVLSYYRIMWNIGRPPYCEGGKQKYQSVHQCTSVLRTVGALVRGRLLLASRLPQHVVLGAVKSVADAALLECTHHHFVRQRPPCLGDPRTNRRERWPGQPACQGPRLVASHPSIVQLTYTVLKRFVKDEIQRFSVDVVASPSFGVCLRKRR